MAISWTDVTNLDASLAAPAVPVAAQTAILADVYAMLDADRWGDKLDLGAKYLAAHTGALVARGGGGTGAGAVMQEALGDASRMFSTSVAYSYHDLDATPWGKRFRLILRGLGVFAITT